MTNNRVRTAAEEELMEAQLDGYNKRRKTGKETDSNDNEGDDKPARRVRRSESEEAKAGRWVAPTILVLTIVISGIFWAIQTLNR